VVVVEVGPFVVVVVVVVEVGGEVDVVVVVEVGGEVVDVVGGCVVVVVDVGGEVVVVVVVGPRQAQVTTSSSVVQGSPVQTQVGTSSNPQHAHSLGHSSQSVCEGGCGSTTQTPPEQRTKHALDPPP
jgi:hypothetical protein